jgi:hypothetical protein
MIVASSDLPIQQAAGTPATLVDLVRRLSDDSKRLAGNEIRLAKLEMTDKLHITGRGAALFGVAFGAGAVALSALTIGVAAALTLAVGKVWISALITGAVEILVGYFVVRGGTRTLASLSRAVPEAGHEILGSARQIASGRAD